MTIGKKPRYPFKLFSALLAVRRQKSHLINLNFDKLQFYLL